MSGRPQLRVCVCVCVRACAAAVEMLLYVSLPLLLRFGRCELCSCNSKIQVVRSARDFANCSRNITLKCSGPESVDLTSMQGL